MPTTVLCFITIFSSLVVSLTKLSSMRMYASETKSKKGAENQKNYNYIRRLYRDKGVSDRSMRIWNPESLKHSYETYHNCKMKIWREGTKIAKTGVAEEQFLYRRILPLNGQPRKGKLAKIDNLHRKNSCIIRLLTNLMILNTWFT